MKKIRNMNDFAVASGLSRPTISKYFNDPAAVRGSTRKKIEEALAKYDYRPNLFAINLNRKKPKNIGVIVPHIVDPFYAEIVRHIETRCLQLGYWAIVLSSHGDPALEASAVQTLLSLKLSGAVIAPLGRDSDADLFRNLRESIPLVFLDARIDNEMPFVGTNNDHSISLIIEYLSRTGEPPCYLDMPSVNRNASERREAYIRAMDRTGTKPMVVECASKTWDFEAIGFEEGNRVLEAGGFPSRTVLCANDRLAFGVMAAAYRKKMKIGREAGSDLRVAGHDDHPLSRYTCPALTTVAQDYSKMASMSLDILLTMIDGGEVESSALSGLPPTLLETKLMMRDSA